MAHTTGDAAAAPDGAPGRVWMYWEKRRPTSIRTPYLDLCLETVEAHLDGLSLEVVDERTIYDWLPDLDQATWERLPRPASRSDYGRNRLLWRYGGIYLDFDCVVIDSLRRLLEPLSRTSLAGWGEEAEGLFYNNLLAARPGSEFLEEWIVAQDRLLHGSDDWPALGYAALGQHLAGDVARHVEHHTFAEDQVAPIPWHHASQFFSTTASPELLLSRRPITVMLWNRAMGERLERVSAEQLLTGRTLLSRTVANRLGPLDPGRRARSANTSARALGPVLLGPFDEVPRLGAPKERLLVQLRAKGAQDAARQPNAPRGEGARRSPLRTQSPEVGLESVASSVWRRRGPRRRGRRCLGRSVVSGIGPTGRPRCLDLRELTDSRDESRIAFARLLLTGERDGEAPASGVPDAHRV